MNPVARLVVVLALGASTLQPIACGGDVVVDGPPSASGGSVSSTGAGSTSSGSTSTGSTSTGSTSTSSTGTGPMDLCAPVTGVPTTCPLPQEVFELLTWPGPSGCSEFGVCHGQAPGASGLYLPKDDIALFFQNLYTYTGVYEMPYVNAQNPAESWMLCSLTGAPGGGLPMPPASGLVDPADVELVRNWLLCGAPAP